MPDRKGMPSSLFLVYFVSLAQTIRRLCVVDAPWGQCMMVNQSGRGFKSWLCLHSPVTLGPSLGHWISFLLVNEFSHLTVLFLQPGEITP